MKPKSVRIEVLGEVPRGVIYRLVTLMLILILQGDHQSIKAQPNSPLVGLADFHTHQFGYLGFGGKVISHSVDPTISCFALLPSDPSTLRMRDLVRNSLFSEAAEQAKSGKCYPTVTNLTSQRMDTDNLHRAWQYGLRLIVMFAVNSEFLCQVAELASPCPSDSQAIELQIRAAKNLEAQIDAESGGPGTGWYRIVYTPAQARDVIGRGKLAVVLGVETSNAFGGCRFTPSGNTPAINGGTPETAWIIRCGYPQGGLESLQTQEALALFEHYWQLGVRHFFPIHNMDGTVGGAALFSPILHGQHNPSELSSAELGNVARDIDNLILAVRPPVQSWNCSRRYEFDGGRCNQEGLTETGRYLLRLMASYGAVIDIDHMSLRAKREVLSESGLFGGIYPFISSHTGIQEINHLDANNEGQLSPEDIQAMVRTGGAFAPILPPATSAAEEDTFPVDASVAPHRCGGTTETFVQAYRYVVDKLRVGSLLNGQPAFVGVGFGTDFGAPVPVAIYPRFEGDVRIVATTTGNPLDVLRAMFTPHPRKNVEAPCYKVPGSSTTGSAEPHVTYPFTSPLDPTLLFERSTTPWGGQAIQYDISFHGMVHIGMVPDFVAELRALGVTDTDLEPLWHGAEAYVRAWETSMAWQGSAFNSEHRKEITEPCRVLRAELLKLDFSQASRDLQFAIERLKRKGCHGFTSDGVTRGIGRLYLSDQGLGAQQDRIEAPTVPAGTNTKFAFFLRNRGTIPVTVTGILVENDPDQMLEPDLGRPVVVAPGQIEGFALEFHPSRPGPFEARIIVLSDEPGLPELPLPVVGTVAAPLPQGQVEIIERNLDFGTVLRGSSASLRVIITNTGNATMNITQVSLAAENPTGQFLLQEVLPQGIEPGESEEYFITYAPTNEGNASAEIIFQTSVAAGIIVEDRVRVRGASGAPNIVLDPAFLDFGAVSPGTSKTMTLTIRNTGSMELVVAASSWVRGFESFVPQSPPHPWRIGVNQQLQYDITFTAFPQLGQVSVGEIEFVNNDPDTPQLRLILQGSTSGIRLAVTDFIGFENPQLTDTQLLEISNLGNMPAEITEIRFETGALFQFTQPLQFPLQVSPGQKITIPVGLVRLPPAGVYFDRIIILVPDAPRPEIRVGVELRL